VVISAKRPHARPNFRWEDLVRKYRQDSSGLGWGSGDHLTGSSSTKNYAEIPTRLGKHQLLNKYVAFI
jgi:hypothetical protein